MSSSNSPFPSPVLEWVAEQTNSVLLRQSEVDVATHALREAKLPSHPAVPKNWDHLLATANAVLTTAKNRAVLDAGAERYSPFLPALRKLGYANLTGINIAFQEEFVANDILYRPDDITATSLPSAHFDFIACLSVIEHGVSLPAFFSEQVRLLVPGGYLFVSCDYWEAPIETHDQYCFGVPIHIFNREELESAVRTAANLGLFLTRRPSFSCRDRVIHWEEFDLRYTFANFLWQYRP